MSLHIQPDREEILAFCRRWRVIEFSFFGSVLRDDFGSDSDVDVLIALSPNSGASLFDLVTMQDELEALFGRSVDLVTREGIEHSRNQRRRQAILTSVEPYYVA